LRGVLFPGFFKFNKYMAYQPIQFKVGPVYVGVQERRVPHNMDHRQHWAARHRWGKQWKESVEAAIWENKKKLGKMPYEKARVLVTLYTMQLLDKDNAYASVKPILDALKIYGVIVDDRIDCIDLMVEQSQVKHRADEKVTLEIERIEGDVGRPNRTHNEGGDGLRRAA
jgi:hypothetical protein